MTRAAFAPAKVNLYLHVGAPGADGYHPICSLMAFADVGDEVAAHEAEALELRVTGPFASQLGDTDDNLVLRAARALIEHMNHPQVRQLGLAGLEGSG